MNNQQNPDHEIKTVLDLSAALFHLATTAYSRDETELHTYVLELAHKIYHTIKEKHMAAPNDSYAS